MGVSITPLSWQYLNYQALSFTNLDLTFKQALANYISAVYKPGYFDKANAKTKFESLQRWKQGHY